MLYQQNKDITTVTQGVVAHGVNCQGRMNSGVAKAIRTVWPRAFQTYDEMSDDRMTLGTVQLVRVEDELDIHVANCFTQEFYGNDGKQYASVEAIETCLDKVCMWTNTHNMYNDYCPVYMPQIGCGLGGLSWEQDIEPIVQWLADKWTDIDIIVCTLE